MEIYTDRHSALQGRGKDRDQTVCGTYRHDGTPVYFLMPADATEREVRAAAFTAREGREMTPYELDVLEAAEARA